MDKSSNSEFKQLIRKQKIVGQPLYQRIAKLSPDDGERYWKARCAHLERELEKKNREYEYVQELLKISEQTIAEMEKTQNVLQETIDLLEQDVDGADIHVGEFNRGIGLSIDSSGSADLYRLSEPDGELIPDRKFKGAEVEISPGRGFRIGLHFDKNK